MQLQPPPDADQLTQLALQQRPDLQALNYDQQAAVKFSRAQRDQMLPNIMRREPWEACRYAPQRTTSRIGGAASAST